MDLKKEQFGTFLESINKCYSKDCAGRLPKANDFPDLIFDSQHKLDISSLFKFLETQTDSYLLSVSKRLIAVLNIHNARESKSDLHLRDNWKLISESIFSVRVQDTISSIGSQGFLSIPLYKHDKEQARFDFIRLHIWDKSLYQYIDAQTCEKFAIHTHSFFCKKLDISWSSGE